MKYTVTDFTQVKHLVREVTRLQNIAFAEYEGAMKIDQAFIDWYLKRPGTAMTMCQAAVDRGTLVSQVIVCTQPLQLGGETFRCGIIDSVATDPEHRNHGLARHLMERAHEAMMDADLDAAVLYTNPDDHPYAFYQRMGYEERARASMLTGGRTDGSGCAAEPVNAAEEEAAGLRALINDYYVGHEGFSPLTEDLWRWHKIDAPAAPVVVAEMTGSGPISTATFADAPIRIEGQEHAVSMAYDVAAIEMNRDQLASLLSAAPREMVGLILDDDSAERQWADALGFEPRVSEVAMVLPFTHEAEVALEEHGGPWYVMVESVVGV